MKYTIKKLNITTGEEKIVAILYDRNAAFEYAETLKAQAFVTIYENNKWIANI